MTDQGHAPPALMIPLLDHYAGPAMLVLVVAVLLIAVWLISKSRPKS